VIEDSDLDVIDSSPADLDLVAFEEPIETKRPRKPGRLIGVALLALFLIVVVILLTPSLRKDFLPKLAAKAGLVHVAPPRVDPDTLPAVPALWQRLRLGGMPDSAVEELRQGKYYYEKRLPGNFGLAIDYWRKALARLEGAERASVQSLVASAEMELARQFSADSADAFVLIRQGKRDQATALLLKMRADYLDISSPQYVWASRMLYRRLR
jgi:hypothetical protein